MPRHTLAAITSGRKRGWWISQHVVRKKMPCRMLKVDINVAKPKRRELLPVSRLPIPIPSHQDQDIHHHGTTLPFPLLRHSRSVLRAATCACLAECLLRHWGAYYRPPGQPLHSELFGYQLGTTSSNVAHQAHQRGFVLPVDLSTLLCASNRFWDISWRL